MVSISTTVLVYPDHAGMRSFAAVALGQILDTGKDAEFGRRIVEPVIDRLQDGAKNAALRAHAASA